MENELELQLVGQKKYTEWMANLPEHIIYDIQSSGFRLEHLIGKYNGYLDEEMNVESLWVAVGLPIEELPNILIVYQKIINVCKNNSI